MRLARLFVPTSIVAALVGCAKGSGLDSSTTQFGVGSTAGTTQTATSAAESSETSAGTDAPHSGSDASSGPLATTGCEIDDPACTGACGNGVIDPGEACDGDATDGKDCVSEGFTGGAVSCRADCTLDTTGCTLASCGDGMVQENESCDCGMAGAQCSAAQLGGQSCTALPSPGGNNYSGGTLGCSSPGSCMFDESACVWCGNGNIDAMESCDGANLAGASCTTQGFDSGSLSCTAGCTFETGACITWVCGNGSCDPDEDSCGCPGDCAPDPNSCDSPCECGLNGGNCWCDEYCLTAGDCCPNGPC